MRLHQVRVACPPGGADSARAFYGIGLGLTEVPAPPGLAEQGGCWFRGYGADGAPVVEVHVEVEQPFVPARKDCPALVIDDVSELEEMARQLEAAGFDVDWSERETLPGHHRFHTHDGAGNRVEVLAPTE